MQSEIIYTDGACSKNGTSKSTGGFGMFIANTKLFSNPLKINCKGQHMKFKLSDSNETTFYVTNIRMEGLAIVSTFALYADALILNPDKNLNAIQRLNSINMFNNSDYKIVYGPNELKSGRVLTCGEIEIITDSQFWINVVESWMPGWIKKGIMLEKKNPDILLMLRYYTELFEQNKIKFKFTHVKSHQKGKRTAHADGNDVADVLATSSVSNTNNEFVLQ